MQSNLIFSILNDLSVILTKAQRTKGLGILLLIITGALLDVFGLAAILPVLSVAMDSSTITRSPVLHSLYSGFGFSSESWFLIALVAVLLVLFIAKNVITFLINYVQANYSGNIATHLAEKQFRKYFSAEYYYIKSQKSSLLVTNIVNIPNFFSTGLLMPLIVLLSELFVLTFIVLGVAFYNVQLLLVLVLILLPTFLILYRATKNKMVQVGKEKERTQPQAYGAASQTVFAYLDVRLSGKESWFLKKFMTAQAKLNKLTAYTFIIHFIPAKVVEVVAVFGVLIIFVYTLLFSGQKEELIMFISLFVAAAYRTMPSLNKILISFMNIKANLYTLNTLMAEPPGVRDAWLDRSGLEPMRFNHSIQVKNLHFRFPDGTDDVLKDISLEIRKGEVVGFYGKSGSGKSTLMRVLLRFYKESGGGILIDGVKLTDINLHQWRSIIGYVKQDPFIMDVSLMENIAFGSDPRKVDMDKLRRSIEGAALEEVVNGLPQGAQTRMGEFGSRFSGGQKQRIEIARALYSDAQILILDEATSALDSQTEREIVDSILRLAREGKTVLTIAHRISTLQGCSRIFQLTDGRITNEFSYNELLKMEMNSSTAS